MTEAAKTLRTLESAVENAEAAVQTADARSNDSALINDEKHQARVAVRGALSTLHRCRGALREHRREMLKINPRTRTGRAKLGDALAREEVRCTARRFDRIEFDASIEAIDSFLAGLHLTREDRIGATFDLAFGETLPSAYRYSADCTVVRVRMFASGWFIVGVRRDGNDHLTRWIDADNFRERVAARVPSVVA